MSNATCLPHETLKRYLSGAIDVDQTNLIEAHLTACAACESAIVQLERDSDPLLDTVRELGQITSQANSTFDSSPSVVKRAIATARLLPEPPRCPFPPLPKVDQIGAYQLLQPLGQGGMGQVFLARHTSLDKQVAIKLLFPRSLHAAQLDLVSRFQREMRAAGRLNHPAIVSATDAGEVHGTHYLVMEYIDGLDLSRIARATGPLAIADACELMRQAALGLSHAHAAGIVHRDIKPSNMMLDTQGRLKILDFGLAQWNLWDDAACELTTVGQLMGTLDYMAPEQAERTDGVDYRADLYAIGATLFRLLTGRAPLAATPSMTLLEKVRLLGSQSAPSLAQFRPDAPPSLVALVASLLQRQPAERPASAAHLAEALQPYCEGYNLGELLVRAQELADRAPESATTEPPRPAPSQPATDSGPPARGGSWRWIWVAAALVPLIIWAGVIVTIELQKGQLVIQSNVSGVEVKVVRDGQPVQELSIQTGAQSTRLRADQYEIIIDAPSDQVSVDKQTFTLRQGETVVATIEKRDTPTTAPRSTESPPPASPAVGDLVKSPVAATTDGARSNRSVDHYLLILSDRQEEQLQVAVLNALAEAVTEGNFQKVTEHLLTKFLPALEGPGDGEYLLNTLRGNRVRLGHKELNAAILGCLAKCNSAPEFMQLLDTRLLTGDDDWVARWLASLVEIEERFSAFHYHSELVEHLLTDEFAANVLSKFNNDNALLWRELIKHRLSFNPTRARMHATTFVTRVLAEPKLGRLSLLQTNPYLDLDNSIVSERVQTASMVLDEAIAAVAIETLSDKAATPEELAHAAYHLATTGPYVVRYREQLVAPLRARLAELSNNSSLRAFTPLPLEPYAPANWHAIYVSGGHVWPGTFDVSSEQSIESRPFWNLRYTNYEALGYLALAKRLQLTVELDEELAHLHQRCIEVAKPLTDLLISRHETIGVFGSVNQAEFDKIKTPYRELPAAVWTASLVERAIGDLGGMKPDSDSKLTRELDLNSARVGLQFNDLNHDGVLSAEELKTYQSGTPIEDKNGDGVYDLEELIANLRAYGKLLAK